MMPSELKKSATIVELLAPAGDLAALRAAIGNGADAVYLGAASFNARRNATNFNLLELAEAIDYAHIRSVRVYLTLNTLIADDEGTAALELAAQAYEMGIDAVILQDIGLAATLHLCLPDLPLHASTQMTLCDRAGLTAAARLGISRVILPRELSLAEIADLTSIAAQMGMTTEVFVHGATCMGYSGQCLLSSMLGGRSGNRGECAQPCRLPWQRSLPGAQTAETSKTFPWLSPRDQALLDYLPGLLAAGVSSFKIEGRMRGSAYVGQVTSIYRSALDRAATWDTASEGSWSDQIIQDKRRLLFAFNRGGGFTDRYVSGRRQADFLSGPHTGSHGMLLGMICGLEARFGLMRVMTDADWPTDACPGRGDVLSIRRPESAQETASAPIGSITAQGRMLSIKCFHPDVLATLQEGDPVYLMNDRQAEQAAQKADQRHTYIAVTCTSDNKQTMLTATVQPAQGTASGLSVSCSCPGESVSPLEADRAETQLKKTGGTAFRVTEISLNGPVSLTISSLNELRRQLIDELDSRLTRFFKRQLPQGFTAEWAAAVAAVGPKLLSPATTHPPGTISVCYIRIPDDTSEIACGADRYLLPLLSMTASNASAICQAIRSAEPDCRIMVWLPAATSGTGAATVPPLLEHLSEWGVDGIYVGNPGLDVMTDAALEKCVDLGANVFNQASLAYYAGLCVKTVSPSPELDVSRLIPLRAMALSAGINLELPLYGRLRLMTSEFCPLGQNLPGCRRCHDQSLTDDNPDQSMPLYLKDRKDQTFPVVLHPRTCTSEVYSHFILSAAADLLRLADESKADLAEGHHFEGITPRLTFLDETAGERRQLTRLARCLLTAGSTDEGKSQAAFQSAARQAAERQKSSLSHGHYLQGV